MMLIKTNICSVQNYLGGNTDRQQFKNDKQNVDVAPQEKFLRTPMNDRVFRFRFLLLTCFHSLRIVCFFPLS